MKLLYRGTRDGFLSETFRQKCANQNQTFVIYKIKGKNNQIENNIVLYFSKHTVSSILKDKFSAYWIIHTFVELIKILEVIFTSNDSLKLLAYQNYKFCFKSVILYGVDIEKIIFLDSLKKFMSVDEIKQDIFVDTDFIEYLKGLLQQTNDSNDQTKLRLNAMIKKFLD